MIGGKLISIEGIDGAGKSTQAQNLAKWLGERGETVCTTSELPPDEFGLALRRIIDTAGPLSGLTELALFSAARQATNESVIRPALSEGAVVICDRYIDSAIAYQGYGRGVSLAKIRALFECFPEWVEPALTILLDTPVDIALERVKRRGKPDIRATDALEIVRHGFLDIAAMYPKRIVVIEGGSNLQDVEVAVEATVKRHFGMDGL